MLRTTTSMLLVIILKSLNGFIQTITPISSIIWILNICALIFHDFFLSLFPSHEPFTQSTSKTEVIMIRTILDKQRGDSHFQPTPLLYQKLKHLSILKLANETSHEIHITSTLWTTIILAGINPLATVSTTNIPTLTLSL